MKRKMGKGVEAWMGGFTNECLFVWMDGLGRREGLPVDEGRKEGDLEDRSIGC